MVLDQPTNFSRGETTSSIASTDTTFDVANASTFADPATGEYNLVVWDQTQFSRPTASGASPEIVRVTARDTTADTLTVSRGQEGTTASAFPSGAALIHTQTAKTFGDIDSTFASFWDEQNQELTADINAANGNIDSFSTDQVNNVRYAAPGSVQSTIDNLASLSNIDAGRNTANGKIKLQPETVYDEGAEVHVKPGITLDMNGAVLTNTADHNLIFLDNGAHLKNGFLELNHGSATAGKAGVVLDSARATYGKYSNDTSGAGSTAASHATAEAEIVGRFDSGGNTMDGILLNDDPTAGAITVGCQFWIDIFRARDGVRLDSTNFINAVEFRGYLTSCTNNIHHVGNAPAESVFYVQHQPNGERAIWNETTQRSVTSVGRLFDPNNAATNALVGPNIEIIDYGGKPGKSQNSDGSAGQRGWAIRNGSIYWEDISEGVDWEWESGFNGALNLKGKGLLIQFKPDLITLQSPINGLREISNPGLTDLASGEWAWDSTNGRWLFRDSSGTAHFFTPDGTL